MSSHLIMNKMQLSCQFRVYDMRRKMNGLNIKSLITDLMDMNLFRKWREHPSKFDLEGHIMTIV